LGIYNATIQVGNGSYTDAVNLKSLIGAGLVTIQGDDTTPSNVTISTTSDNAIEAIGVVGRWRISGFKTQTTTSGTNIHLDGSTTSLAIGAHEFGASAGFHTFVLGNAKLTFDTDYTISGGAGYHWRAFDGGGIFAAALTITLTGTPAFSTAFAIAARQGRMLVYSNTFSGSATGQRYIVQSLGLIYTNGAGTSYLPGNSSGSGTTPGSSPYGLYE
jgi:hypothetical protein